ncbi:MAG TPA: hypothetical protein VK553_02435 [Candidatus Nitrosopolaris rasttigaisensis]|nr:hypothetical protein [Candidatus Nitrosopolaris rasttigaisensis]
MKADKKAVKILQENLNEEKTFGSWLERNNPRLARKIMRNQLNEKQKAKKEISTTSAATTPATSP